MSVAEEILKHYHFVDNELQLGGRSASSLAEEFGTPLYVYDGQSVSRRIKTLREALPDGISLYYAVKANPMLRLLRLLAARVDGMDIASAGELQLALEAGVKAEAISFAGPGKRDQELQQAVQAGALLSVESASELERIASIGSRLGQRPKIALRINPAFRLRASGMHMGGGASPFGIDEEAAPELLQSAVRLPVALQGIHIYAGSQNLSAAHLIEAQNAIFELAFRWADYFPEGMKWLNIGGGFGIPYFSSDRPLDIEAVAGNLAQRLEDKTARLGECKVVLELGRYLVGEAGVYLCRVTDRKVSRGQTYLVTDGGMHHHLAASGNFGQIIRKNYPVILARHDPEGSTETVNVVGPLCTPLDILGDKIELGHAEAGDLIAILQSGAYGFSASPQGFLSHPPPVQILV